MIFSSHPPFFHLQFSIQTQADAFYTGEPDKDQQPGTGDLRQSVFHSQPV
jgi:hypothetical protein